VKITVQGCSANFTHQTTTGAADVATTVQAVKQPKVAKLINAAHASGLQAPATSALSGLMHYLIGPAAR
jgi:hypothetical protein